MYDYILVFLEGLITFISPCLLPMLPVYVLYFAGGEEAGGKNTLKNSVGFVMGFAAVFTVLGAFAGAVGDYFKAHQSTVNLVSGIIVIIFGLNYLGVFRLGFFEKFRINKQVNITGFWSALLFGMLFSIGWTPCVGAFLSSALTLAAQRGSVLEGVLMLLMYSLGLGIPFIVSAMLIDQLKGAFDWIKKHYKVINAVSGGLLIVMGILMATGLMGYYLGLLI